MKQKFRSLEKYSYLFNPKVRIRRDDRPTGEINPFPGQISSEPSLFSLQPLHKPSEQLLTWDELKGKKTNSVKV